MRLALSTAAAPAASFAELADAAARRGLGGVELVQGHGHGVEPAAANTRGPRAEELAEAAEVAARATGAGITLAGYRLASWPGATAAPGPLAVLSVALTAPVVVPMDGPPESWEDAARTAAAVARHGGQALALLPAGPAGLEGLDVVDAVDPTLPVGWIADPQAGGLGSQAARLVSRADRRLRHVVLRGGGPEATEQAGRGIGAFMAHLALAGYTGTLALTPSSDRYRVIWDAWLGRRGGWGCGSKSEDRTLVTLGGVA